MSTQVNQEADGTRSMDKTMGVPLTTTSAAETTLQSALVVEVLVVVQEGAEQVAVGKEEPLEGVVVRGQQEDQ